MLLLAGHGGTQVSDFAQRFRQSGQHKIDIGVSIEPEPLGTAGAIKYAQANLDDQFLLLNGDSWFDFNWLDLHALLAANRRHS